MNWKGCDSCSPLTKTQVQCFGGSDFETFLLKAITADLAATVTEMGEAVVEAGTAVANTVANAAAPMAAPPLKKGATRAAKIRQHMLEKDSTTSGRVAIYDQQLYDFHENVCAACMHAHARPREWPATQRGARPSY